MIARICNFNAECGSIECMPTYAQPNVPSYLEGVINAFGNLTKVAIIEYLTTHGPSTAGEVALGIEVGVPTAKYNLYLLASRA